MYTLGFTSKRSVRERFSYGGSQDYKLIDKELVFAHLANAYEVEQELHAMFRYSRGKVTGRYDEDPTLPLYKNGQSELYYEDILRLDPQYDSSVIDRQVEREKELKKEMRFVDALTPWSALYLHNSAVVTGNLLGRITTIVILYPFFVLAFLLKFSFKLWVSAKYWLDSRDEGKVAARDRQIRREKIQRLIEESDLRTQTQKNNERLKDLVLQLQRHNTISL